MSRFTQIAPETATGKAKELLYAVKSKLGLVPNMTRAMANSPAVLNAYLQFSGALAAGSLSAKNREQIALAVGQTNDCDYCLSAHSALGKMAGLTAGPNPRQPPGHGRGRQNGRAAALRPQAGRDPGPSFRRRRGRLRQAGLTDGEIAEVVAGVALNIFTNYFNHVADDGHRLPEGGRPAPTVIPTPDC